MKQPTKQAAPQQDTFSFRWGIDVLDDADKGTFVFRFILEHYAALGVAPDEMMFVVHLSDFKYDSARGAARPSLTTIGRLMGHDTQYARRLKNKLVAKGLLQVIENSGCPHEYNFAELSKQAIKLWRAKRGDELCAPPATPIKFDRGIKRDRGTPITGDRTPLSPVIGEEKQSTRNKKKGAQTRTTTPRKLKPKPSADNDVSRAVSGKLRASLSMNPAAPGGIPATDDEIAEHVQDMELHPFKAFLPDVLMSDTARELAHHLAQTFGYTDALIGAGCSTKKQRKNERERWLTVNNLLSIAQHDVQVIKDAAEYFKTCLVSQGFRFVTPDSLRKTLTTWIANNNVTASPAGDEVDGTEYIEVETPFGKVLQAV